MRRTTICRSDITRSVALIAVLAGAARLEAQRPAPAGAPALPATHFVQRGETLWGLAQQFLGDPLLWPEIYRLNTDVVEDPHWIFPGEELRLGAGDRSAMERGAAIPGAGNVAVIPGEVSARGVSPVPTAEAALESPTIFASRPVESQDFATIEMREEEAYRAVRPGEYYASGFIADRSTLPTGTLVGTVERAAIRRLTTRTSAALYSAVIVKPPPGQEYRVGDMLLVYTVDQQLRGYGDVIKPLGLLDVLTEANSRQNGTARVMSLYGPVHDGASLTRIAPFQYSSAARAQPIDSGVVGQVIAFQSGRALRTSSTSTGERTTV
jgi:hypothetical protein